MVPYQEPKIEDGALLEQPMLDLLDLDYEAASQVFSKLTTKIDAMPVKKSKKRTFKEAMQTCQCN